MIELQNISKKYDQKTIIDDISLSFDKGKITFIVGTSGVGKTTLLNIIGGLSKPTAGKVLFEGEDISEDLNTYRGKHVGFVFQDFNLIPGLSIVDNVLIATEIAGIAKQSDSIATEVSKFEISDPYQKVETLSGGEKQRTAIVRSICKNADILIADEPTGNLDSNNANLVLDMLQSMKEDKYVIVVSHDMENARKYADRIVTLSDGLVTSDEHIDRKEIVRSIHKKNQSKDCEKKLYFKTISRLGRNSIKIRKSKIISITMVIAMAIAAIATVIELSKSGNSISHNVNVNYLENDLINLYYGSTPNTGYMEYPFETKDIKEIEEKYDINQKVLLYLCPSNEWIFSSNTKVANVNIKQININDFFENRVFSNDIKGKFITKKNEIILASDVAEQLYSGDDCIGNTVILNDGRGNSIEYTIVGINYTRNPYDQIYSFISSDSLKEMLSDCMNENIYQRQELIEFQTEVKTMITGGVYGTMQNIDGTEELLYGSYPTSKEGVLISSSLLMQVYNEFDITNYYSYEQVLSGKILSEDVKKIFSKKMVLNFNGVFPVWVEGIYNSDDIEMRFSEQLISQMQVVDPISIDIYVSDPEQVSQIKESMNQNYDFEALAQLETLKDNVSMQTRFFSIALGLIGVVLILISCALLSSFVKISVLERKKEIAIVKSLGAGNKIVLCILLFDSAVISILSFGIAIIFWCAIKVAIPYMFTSDMVTLLGYNWKVIIIIGLVSTLLIVLLTSLNLKKLVKQMPAELLV